MPSHVEPKETCTWTGALAERRFSEFDDAWLEREYSPSSAINGNYEPYVTSWVQRSAAVRTALVSSSLLGERYGTKIRNIIDVFPAPSTDGSPSPALIFFHGGYWQECSLRDVSFPAAALNAAGITYISVDYTLAPKATLTEIVEEARQAVRFVVGQKDRFGVDLARLVIGGHSAGAHLAALSGGGVSLCGGDIDSKLLLISGIYELLPLLRTSINGALNLTGQEIETLSVLRHPPQCQQATLVWGDSDTTEFAWQSKTLRARFGEDQRIGAFESIEIAGRNHFDLLLDLADRSSQLFSSLQQMLE
jgi:arylformamidase